MSFKDKIPVIILSIGLPLVGGILAASVYSKGYRDGHDAGFKLGVPCGKLEKTLEDITNREIKFTFEKSDKKKEA